MNNICKQKNKGPASYRPANASRGGFTLVETLVAISIFTGSILGLMAILSQGLSNTQYAKNKMIAAYLAQEGIEYVRNVRDNYVLYNASGAQAGWTSFRGITCTAASPCGYNATTYPVFVCSGNTCNLYVNNGNYNASSLSGTDSGFVRRIVIEPVTADESKITSTISWPQGSTTKIVSFTENLYNWAE